MNGAYLGRYLSLPSSFHVLELLFRSPNLGFLFWVAIWRLLLRRLYEVSSILTEMNHTAS
jgi:hypothetical protein